MKNKLKFFRLIAFVAMIGISTVAYSADGDTIVNNTNGSLTISGFPSTYYGKQVFAIGEDVIAASNVSSDGTITLGQISTSGSVTLKVWKANWDEAIFNNYNGSGTFDLAFMICNTSTFSEDEDEFIAYGEITVTFNNGTGSGKIGNIIILDD